VEVAEKLSGDDIGVSPHYLKIAAIEAVLERAIHCSGGRQTFVCSRRRMADDVHLQIVYFYCREKNIHIIKIANKFILKL
jgi:hypothetical protein